ncbi:hypothetical protein GALMADRAFT_143166 [Galerina marginata CBS 339.88]|uniref:Uncharacterized protein n=1 Tax=Galerina marginata (strain CBS 339.88) TaxID=685588 RepID=A0A067SX99_GALM3|nr:hypothetical protein GALMADRAFT_143166 [Galerina marginata CBS 339.88]
MTEYDYSPGARERYLVKQAQIADWVNQTQQHEPANPFMSIPGEHTPSETYNPPLQPYQPTPQYPYQIPQLQPAFYATPQGLVSPTYSSSSKRHRQRHNHQHGSGHYTSGSKSQVRPSPQTATFALPMNTGPYAPMPQRSASTPPSLTVLNSNGMVVPVAMSSSQSYFGYPAQQHQFYQPQLLGYPAPYLTSPPVMNQSYSPSSSHTHSRPSSSRHSSRSRDYSYQPQANYAAATLQSPSYGQVYQPSSNQPVVIPMGAGGYVIVPAGQSVQFANEPKYSDSEYQHYQPDYHSDSESDRGRSSFFGGLSLKGLRTSLKGRSRKSKGRSAH